MKIWFSTATSYTVADLIGFSKTRGIGFEEDFNSSATLYRTEDGKIFWGDEVIQKCNPNLPLTETDLTRGPVWVTAWSGFMYQRVGHENGRDLWEYNGAENGFLNQELIFSLPDVKVQEVEGTYGSFKGESALILYSAFKREWTNKVWALEEIINNLYGKKLVNVPGGCGRIAAALWQAGQAIQPGFHENNH